MPDRQPSDLSSPPSSVFPPRILPVVRVGSPAEQDAYLRAYPSLAGPWRITGRTQVIAATGPEEHTVLTAPDGGKDAIRFVITTVDGSTAEERPPGARLDALMERAVAWAKEFEPTHPGTMPRFPVPAVGYPGRVAVPLALLAVDDARQPGLYGPTRAIILPFREGEVVGAIDAPGFDPDVWPPRRLGPWPPTGLVGIDQSRLSGIVRRFSALWERLLPAYLAETGDLYRRDETAEALGLLTLLDPAPMLTVYADMSPRFWTWVTDPVRRAPVDSAR